ncbi:Aldolase-type TIM barrel [Moorella glycerini]|uniref:4-hydroxy-tetrahydrodipicolinate synthase n=1 Tax=Neomoorella stamsii TaxID=1266720 RepID=A0A9X7J5J0_9FIRM|nr:MULTISPECIES: dihydrodipicolinate synthase family protein [Moorella]PRR77562.1 4-hydroxy-tetrahydrodipicolinate synthase [Moorella stamsii]CEP69391.1 Aldolase-type TIM barrel [Moorella glycerini]
MNYRKLEGIIAATVTPVTEEGQLNLEVVARLTHFLIEKGVHGLFPCGSTGEGVLLTTVERKQVAEITVKEAAGRVPVVIHTGSINLTEAIELTTHARDIGADGAALIPPYYYSIDEITMLNYYRAVARQVPDFPLYIYNIPGNVKNAVSPKVVAQLQSEFPNIVGIKDSSMDFMNFINFRQAVTEDFCILMGNDAQIYASLLMGCSGAVAATATVFPEPVVEIYESLKAGDRERALRAQDLVIKLRAIFRSYTHVAPYKKALEFRGIDAGVPHSPLRPLTSEESRKLREQLEDLGLPF